MLVLTMKIGDEVRIRHKSGEIMWVTRLDDRRVGFTASRDFEIHRGKVLEKRNESGPSVR